ncbi:MAG: UDP-N-acetylmuramoyl-L-alanyl-D-glutamate--2,6-diaminopimelate ligase [Gammaproteobacteria bacterium]
MRLSELLKGIGPGIKDREISGLSLDSREVAAGDLFIALSGATQHGLRHVGQAVSRGAVAVLFDPAGDGRQLAEKTSDITLIPVENLNAKLGTIASRFFGDPSSRLNVIGITGTNGKTSCSQFLSQMLNDCGVIGTLGWGEWGKLNTTVNTTPNAVAVQRMLSNLLQQKKQSVAMEVSSHGLEQGRVNGVRFKGAVLTNISRDHLDYHGTMNAYVEAKTLLFEKPDLEFAVVNLDDEYGGRMMAAIPQDVRVLNYSASGTRPLSGESLVSENIEHKQHGIEFDVCWLGEKERVRVPLFGDFNIDNVLAVLGVMLALGNTLAESAARLRSLKPVSGRMERFGKDSDPVIFVDYAHTPDALEKVVVSIRKHCRSDLWVVFGCGGNRDSGKRSEMGAIAEKWADHVIITDDNPRFEDGAAIVDDILTGCRSDKIEVIRDRAKAIEAAIQRAKVQDYVVIAGKGHEQYQEINGVKLPFSDVNAVKTALEMRSQNNYANAFE